MQAYLYYVKYPTDRIYSFLGESTSTEMLSATTKDYSRCSALSRTPPPTSSR